MTQSLRVMLCELKEVTDMLLLRRYSDGGENNRVTGLQAT